MQLSELSLNRYLYKDIGQEVKDSSLMANNSNTTNYGAGSGDINGGSQTANSVAPGTVITQVILQSSPGPDRVQIGPADEFIAYNNNVVVVRIDKNGISVTGGATLVTSNIGTLNVTTKFNYAGEPQPVAYTGFVSSVGAISNGPIGWTASQLLTGTYLVTHNLALPSPYMRLHINTSTSSVTIVAVNSTANSFLVVFRDLAGATIDADFNFLALRYLP